MEECDNIEEALALHTRVDKEAADLEGGEESESGDSSGAGAEEEPESDEAIGMPKRENNQKG